MDATAPEASPRSFGTTGAAAHPGVGSVPLDDDPAATIFKSIADGECHRLNDLARVTFGRTDADAIARVVGELQVLRDLGMASSIESSTVRAAPIALLDAASIVRYIGAARTRWTIRVAHSIESTNSESMAELRHGSPRLPLLLTTEIQRAGRGRLGRTWRSSIGASLTASFAIRLRRRLSDLDGVTLVCGLAVRQVLDECGVAAGVKWPNDLVVDDRKLAGILVESCVRPADGGEATALVVGIGLNVRPTAVPDGFASGPALSRTSLEQCGSRVLDRNALCARLALALDRELSAFETCGFAAFVQRWNAVDAYRDRAVRLTSGHVTNERGVARGVDDRGALMIDIDGARRHIVAGEVSLRPAAA